MTSRTAGGGAPRHTEAFSSSWDHSNNNNYLAENPFFARDLSSHAAITCHPPKSIDSSYHPNHPQQQYHHRQAFGGGGPPPTSVATITTNTSCSIRRKAKTHRKRHIPVGPAGVWFQTQQTGKVVAGSNNGIASTTSSSSARKEPTHNGDLISDRNNNRESPPSTQSSRNSNNNHNTNNNDSTGNLSLCSSAWMCMQCDLNLTLPSMPSHLTQDQNYSVLRRCLPSDYLLLPELLHRTNAQWTFEHKRVLVVVQTIQSLTDNLWTVQVSDDTGVTMTAWIQPKLAQDEQQRPQPHYIRPGYVWLLVNPTTILCHDDHNHNNYGSNNNNNNDNNSNQSLDRILLVSHENISRVWTPAQAKDITDDAFVRWLEQRSIVSSQALESLEQHHTPCLQQQQQQQETSHDVDFNENHPNGAQQNTRNHTVDDNDDEQETEWDLPVSKLSNNSTGSTSRPLSNQHQPVQGRSDAQNPYHQSVRATASQILREETTPATDRGSVPTTLKPQSETEEAHSQEMDPPNTARHEGRHNERTRHASGITRKIAGSSRPDVVTNVQASTPSYGFSQYRSPTSQSPIMATIQSLRQVTGIQTAMTSQSRTSAPTELRPCSLQLLDEQSKSVANNNTPTSSSRRRSSSKKLKKECDPIPAHSRKVLAPSALWTTNCSEMLDLFDGDLDEDEEGDNDENPGEENEAAVDGIHHEPHSSNEIAFETTINVDDDMGSRDKTKSQGFSLFHMSSYANAELDDLFDEDPED